MVVQPTTPQVIHQFGRRFDVPDVAIARVKFAIAAQNLHEILGVCVVGPPRVGFHNDNWTLEAFILAGTTEAKQFLLDRAFDGVVGMGYHRLLCYRPNGLMFPIAAGMRPVGELADPNAKRAAPCRLWMRQTPSYPALRYTTALTNVPLPPPGPEPTLFDVETS